uniref:Uncharacterized protein n=1 Tax=Laticauda laticaudata TaxID=8630 RepID=A0A8C5S926_LATLA
SLWKNLSPWNCMPFTFLFRRLSSFSCPSLLWLCLCKSACADFISILSLKKKKNLIGICYRQQ